MADFTGNTAIGRYLVSRHKPVTRRRTIAEHKPNDQRISRTRPALNRQPLSLNFEFLVHIYESVLYAV